MECEFCSETAKYIIKAEVIGNYETWTEYVCTQHFVERGLTIEGYNAGEEPETRVIAKGRIEWML